MSITQNVQSRKLQYNNFNLSHTHDTSGRIGKLIPVMAMPVVAGDLIKEKVEFNLRLSPLSAPAMARFNVHFHSFYVPYRLLSPRNGQETTWEKMVMNVGSTSDDIPLLPHFHLVDTPVANIPDANNVGSSNWVTSVHKQELQIGSLWDYMKLPILPFNAPDNGVVGFNEYTLGKPGIIAWNFLAYQKIFNDWYRRDQIEQEIVFPLNLSRIDMADARKSQYVEPELPENVKIHWNISAFLHQLLTLRTRNYERDYFTSALPEPQFGDDVMLSGGHLTSVLGANIALSSLENFGVHDVSARFNDSTFPMGSILTTYSSGDYPSLGVYNTQHNPSYSRMEGLYGKLYGNFGIDSLDGVYAQPFSINELRMAFQIQGVREQINRGGTRYTEIMKSVFGVTVSDLRIQRVQYLGGYKAPISIGAVLQTSESDTTPQGTLTGVGGSVGGNLIFKSKRIFEEAGVIMTIMSVTPRTGYFGGIPREYLKFDPIDYYTPAFDRLGEQEINRRELMYPVGVNPDDYAIIMEEYELDQNFGYSPHYSEYKTALSTATGEFRDSLDNWHVYRSFDRPPTLSPDFIHAEPEDFDRLFEFENIANTSNEHFQVQLYFDIKAKRPMSKYSTPYTLF